jgi:hypothetical protein
MTDSINADVASAVQAATAAVAGATEQPAIPVLTDTVTQEGATITVNEHAAVLAEQSKTLAVSANPAKAASTEAVIPVAAKRPAIGPSQAGNGMDTMHGKVNATWPPKVRVTT